MTAILGVISLFYVGAQVFIYGVFYNSCDISGLNLGLIVSGLGVGHRCPKSLVSILTPGGDDERCCLALPSSVEDKHDIQQHLNAFSEHQKERRQEEVVKQHRRSLAPVLQCQSINQSINLSIYLLISRSQTMYV